MFHLLAYQKAQPIGATLAPLTAVQDQMIPSNPSGNFILPANMQLEMSMALGVNLSQARINTPSLRSILLPDIYPVISTFPVGANPQLNYLYGGGPVIPRNDAVEIDTTNASGAVSDQQYAALWLSDGNRNLPQGQRFKLHATAAITAADKVWGSGPLTFDQVLPYGTFAVVGMQAVGTNVLLARLIFVGGGWRPGVLANQVFGNAPNPLFQSGTLGEFGRFESNAPPTLEVLGNGVPTTQQVWLDLVKVF